MADSWMPDVQVDIAFTSGYTTPAASRTWTDVSTYVELADRIQIAFGRQDERSTADANQLTLTLDNTDGRFTAGRAASPYFPNVKIGRPIRVRVTPPGGSVVTRFVGFIDEWPVEWEGSDKYAKATVRATSRMSRLGLTAKMRSFAEYATEAGATAYWKLGEASGASAAIDPSTGRQLSQVLSTVPGATTAPVNFGQSSGSVVDGFPAPTFGAGYFLQAPAEDLPPGSGYTLRAYVRVGALPTLQADIISYTWQGVRQPVQLLSNGRVAISGLSGPVVSDGAAHDLALKVVPGVSTELFVDGASVGTSTPTTFSVPTRSTAIAVGDGFTGSIAHVGFYSSLLSSSTLADHSAALLNGYSGERTDQRLTRILGWAGVPSSEITAQTGQQTMTYQKTSGQSFVDALREVESTEAGVLFDRPDGNVGFHNRAHRYLSAPAATLNMAAQHVGTDYTPKLDRSALVNDATVSNPTTGETARNSDVASSDEYGVASGSTSMTPNAFDPLQQRAYWMTAAYATPRVRVPSLTVDILAHQGLTPSAQTLLGVTVGDLLAVTNAPTQADTTSPSYFVEGYAETIGPESYEVSFNLSPTYPTLNTFVLDSATRGVLDSSYVLAL